MIFVTVGGQLPFDRLIRAVDGWAGEHAQEPVIAQIGSSGYLPKYMSARRLLTPAAFGAYVDDAQAVVAHAGIGTILACLERKKPLLIVPRRASLGEHRNDHQMATVRNLADRAGIWVALDEAELWSKLQRIHHLSGESMHLGDPSPELIERVMRYCHAE